MSGHRILIVEDTALVRRTLCDFLRQQGYTIAEINRTVYMPVVEALVRYVRPARLDDLLDVRCWVSERKRASFRFGYEIRNEAGEVVATGSTLHACWDASTNRMIGVPAWLQAIMPVASGAAPDGPVSGAASTVD